MSTASTVLAWESRPGMRDSRRWEGAWTCEYWPISEAQRAVVVERLVAIMAAPATRSREAVSAARTLLAFSKINLQTLSATTAAGHQDAACHSLELLEPDHRTAPARRKRGRHDHRRARRTLDTRDLERYEGIAPFRVGKVSEASSE